MRYRVSHETTYAYEELVSICHNELRLQPRETDRQRRLGTALHIAPMPRAEPVTSATLPFRVFITSPPCRRRSGSRSR